MKPDPQAKPSLGESPFAPTIAAAGEFKASSYLKPVFHAFDPAMRLHHPASRPANVAPRHAVREHTRGRHFG